MQGHYYTPDFLVLRKNSVCFEEWKTEADLIRLAALHPSRYQRMEDGSWRCPPAEASVQPFGLTFRLRSSAELSATYVDNLSFLADYVGVPLAVPASVHTAIVQRIRETPGLPLTALVGEGSGIRPNDVYVLLSQEQIYTDLYAVPLIHHRRCTCILRPSRPAPTSTFSHPAKLLVWGVRFQKEPHFFRRIRQYCGMNALLQWSTTERPRRRSYLKKGNRSRFRLPSFCSCLRLV